jgi:hypothetical protein
MLAAAVWPFSVLRTASTTWAPAPARAQGIAALVTGGMVQAEQLDELVADAIAHFLRGSRVAP